MDDLSKQAFAAVLTGKRAPESCPEYMVRFYDLLSKRRREFHGNNEPEYADRWWVAALAESFHERDEIIRNLEARVRELETNEIESVSPDESIDEASHVDRRTKAGRALKMASVGA